MAKTQKGGLPAQPQSTAVAPWQEQLAKEAAEGAKTETLNTNSVSFKSGILSFDGQPIAGNKMNVVVLDSAFLHAWYPHAFDPNNIRSPDCWAIGRVEAELAPPAAESLDDRQGDSEGKCLNCPLNAWGSDPDGGRGKACKNQRRLLLISAETLQAGEKGIAAATPVMATIPVTSVKNWSQFVIQMANVVKRPAYGVIATLEVVPDLKWQFQVKWTFVDVVPDELIPAMMEKRRLLADQILQGFPKNGEEQAPPAQPAAKPAGKPAGKPGQPQKAKY